MQKSGNIVRYTAAELRAMIARGESKSDWARVRAMTEEELEESIADDPDWKDIPENWYENAVAVMPAPKRLMSIRLDPDVIDWLKGQGPGYQTRINAVLRAFVDQQAGKRRA